MYVCVCGVVKKVRGKRGGGGVRKQNNEYTHKKIPPKFG